RRVRRMPPLQPAPMLQTPLARPSARSISIAKRATCCASSRLIQPRHARSRSRARPCKPCSTRSKGKATPMINATGNRMTREIARQSQLADRINDLQIQVSSGKRLQRASDDPVAARRIATIGIAQASGATWAANVASASAQVSQADAALGSISNLLVRARELALSAASDTMNASDRASVAAELAGITDEIDGIAARRDANGEPLFA